MAAVPLEKKLELLAWNWKYASRQERKEIVQASFLLAGIVGIKYLARETNLPPDLLARIGNIKNFRHQKNRWRRGRGPSPRRQWLEREYQAMSCLVEEPKAGRRFTASSATQKKARKL